MRRAVLVYLLDLDRSVVGELEAEWALHKLHRDLLGAGVLPLLLEHEGQWPDGVVLQLLRQLVGDVCEVGAVPQLLVRDARKLPALLHLQVHLGVAVEREVVRDDGRELVVLDAQRPVRGVHCVYRAVLVEVEPDALRNRFGLRRRRLRLHGRVGHGLLHHLEECAEEAAEHHKREEEEEPPGRAKVNLRDGAAHLLRTDSLPGRQRRDPADGPRARGRQLHGRGRQSADRAVGLHQAPCGNRDLGDGLHEPELLAVLHQPPLEDGVPRGRHSFLEHAHVRRGNLPDDRQVGVRYGVERVAPPEVLLPRLDGPGPGGLDGPRAEASRPRQPADRVSLLDEIPHFREPPVKLPRVRVRFLGALLAIVDLQGRQRANDRKRLVLHDLVEYHPLREVFVDTCHDPRPVGLQAPLRAVRAPHDGNHASGLHDLALLRGVPHEFEASIEVVRDHQGARSVANRQWFELADGHEVPVFHQLQIISLFEALLPRLDNPFRCGLDDVLLAARRFHDEDAVTLLDSVILLLEVLLEFCATGQVRHLRLVTRRPIHWQRRQVVPPNHCDHVVRGTCVQAVTLFQLILHGQHDAVRRSVDRPHVPFTVLHLEERIACLDRVALLGDELHEGLPVLASDRLLRGRVDREVGKWRCGALRHGHRAVYGSPVRHVEEPRALSVFGCEREVQLGRVVEQQGDRTVLLLLGQQVGVLRAVVPPANRRGRKLDLAADVGLLDLCATGRLVVRVTPDRHALLRFEVLCAVKVEETDGVLGHDQPLSRLSLDEPQVNAGGAPRHQANLHVLAGPAVPRRIEVPLRGGRGVHDNLDLVAVLAPLAADLFGEQDHALALPAVRALVPQVGVQHGAFLQLEVRVLIAHGVLVKLQLGDLVLEAGCRLGRHTLGEVCHREAHGAEGRQDPCHEDAASL
mmetsp:Transcript_19340/g.53154  ORF Transcript_19340/g.53154 Transcript_19340/m.53154 type:complete len:915 (+) Transcript_19340:475-3219(+)